MKDYAEYIQKVDDLLETVLDIRADILMNTLLEKAHTYQIESFDDAVIERYKSRVTDQLEQRQNELYDVSEQLVGLCNRKMRDYDNHETELQESDEKDVC